MSASINRPASDAGGLRQTIGHSAEYAIALALLVVGLAVGAVVWFGSRDEPRGTVTEISMASDDLATDAATRMKAEEDAALAELRRELHESLNEVEARGRMEAELAAQERAAAEARRVQLQELEQRQREAEQLRQQLESEQERLQRIERERAEAAAATVASTSRPSEPQLGAPAPPPSPTAETGEPAPVRVALTTAREPVITKPSVLWDSCERPAYPRASLRAGEEGVTVISLDIDASGAVTNGSVRESSGHRRLDEATLGALSQCQFRPATTDGTPTATTGVFRFAWNLR